MFRKTFGFIDPDEEEADSLFVIKVIERKPDIEGICVDNPTDSELLTYVPEVCLAPVLGWTTGRRCLFREY